MHLFSNVKYHTSSTLSLEDRNIIESILDANGAAKVALAVATHIVSTSPEFDGWPNVEKDVAVVTPKWVERSLVLGKCQPSKFYSAEHGMLFSGVVACATDLIPADVEVLNGAISALGGQWRPGLTRDVTHLFALDSTSEKYQTAMFYQKDTRVKVLVPHWFDDVVRLGSANIPTLPYEWPDPKLLQPGCSPSQDGKRHRKPSDSQSSVFKSAIFALNSDLEIPDQLGVAAEQLDIWKGKRILLSKTLQTSSGRITAIKAGIVRCGGVLVDDPRSANDEANKIDEADVFITRYRSGTAYIKALKYKDKLVGTLAWLFHVQTMRAITAPTDQLLHYPVPEAQVAGFEKHEITVTNYTGDAREYLKRLIEVMGGTFTPSMSLKNTVVIAAFSSGNKTDKALHWSIPIVNHTWLEDCFVQWKNLTVGLEKYVKFPPGFDFSTMLGDKGVGRKVLLEDAELEVPESASSSIVMERDLGLALPESSAKEVEDAVLIDGNDKEMDDDRDVIMVIEDNNHEDVIVIPQEPKAQAVVVEEPEDEPMDSSLPPPPPKKLIQRARTRRALIHPNEDSPEPLKDAETSRISSPKKDGISPPKPSKSKIEDEEEFSPSETHSGTTPQSTDDDELPSRLTSPKLARTRSAQKRKADNEVHEKEEDEESDTAGERRPTSNIQVKKTMEKPPKIKPPPSKRLSPVKQKRKDTDVSSDENTVAPSKTSPRLQTPNHAKKTVVTKTPAMIATDSPARNGRPPKRTLSVIVPALPDYVSPKKTNNPPVPKPLRKDPSLCVHAAEALVQNGKRVKPSTAGGQSKKNAAVEESEDQSTRKTSRVGPPKSKSTHVEPEMEISPRRSRRKAANKATQALRDVVMPDMNKFEKERKRGSVINEWEKEKGEGTETASRKRLSTADDDEEQPERKKARISNASKVKKGKKFAELQEEEEESDDEAEEDHPRGSKRGEKPMSDGGENDDDPDRRRQLKNVDKNRKKRKVFSKSEEDDAAPSSTNPADIRLMTTKVQLSEDTLKALSKLRIKITTKPSECTHLIAVDFGRTEKILCAIAVAPYILREEWATQSAIKKRILPEKDYLLEDTDTEAKYEFTMAESLQRAKKNRGKLLEGKTFYVTPNVKVDMKLLKNIVLANGGQLLQQSPTIRILKGKENRYAVSSEEDKSIWRPLWEQGLPIYSKELLLTGILTQNVKYGDDTYRLDGTL